MPANIDMKELRAELRMIDAGAKGTEADDDS
jgi:hypothetical protein